MASTKERAWLAAHQKGSKALIAKLDKAHANNPEYQAFKQKHGLGDTSSVKQVSKSQVDAKKEKARQVLAGKAYGATKGTRMGSAEGTGETLRDTIAPLTRDQHSAVKAAEKAAKDAEKPAKPVKAPKPKKEKAAAPAPEKKKPTALELIAAAAAKRKINAPPVSAKALRRIAAVGDMEHDHGGFEDLGDTQYGGRRSYNEEVKLDEVAKWRENPAAHDYDTDGTKLPKTHGQHDQLQARSKYLSGAKAYIQNNIKNPKNARKQSQAYAKSAIKMYKEGLEHVEEAIVEGGNYGKPYNNVESLKSKSNKELQDNIDFWKRAKAKNPQHTAIANDQIAKTMMIRAERIGKKTNEEVKLDEAKHTSTIGAMSAAAYMPKVDDKVLVRIGGGYGHVRGKVVKVTDSHVSFIHSESGKRYKTPISNVIKEEAEQIDENDYSRRRKKEEDIISGKKPERKKIPMGSDYASRRRKERLANNGRMDEEMKMRVGTIVKLKKPIDGHEYARVKGFSSSGHTRGPTGRGVPMPAGKVTKVHVALKKTKDDAYDPGPVTHIQHDDVHSVIRESAPGWMLRQNPELAKKVRDKIKLAKKRQKQMGVKEPIKEARKKYYQGGALFADTAARLQKAINAHKERMDQATNGPEHEYHHPTLDIRTKSRLKLPSPWVKVEDK